MKHGAAKDAGFDDQPATELAQTGTDAGNTDAKAGWFALPLSRTFHAANPAAIVLNHQVRLLR